MQHSRNLISIDVSHNFNLEIGVLIVIMVVKVREGECFPDEV